MIAFAMQLPGEDPQAPSDKVERAATMIGIIFYVAGTLAFVGIAIAFFAYRLYEASNGSRIAFIILFAGLFACLQGMVFLLAARRGETRRQMDFILQQIRQQGALSEHRRAARKEQGDS